MRLYLLSAIVLGGLAATASAQLGNPAGPQPQPMVAQMHGGLIILQENQEAYNTVSKTVQMEENGVTRTKQVQSSEPISMKVERAVSAGDYRIFDLAGNQLTAAAAAERLATATPVLTSDHRSKLDPLYLQVFKPNTLIIYLRPRPVSAMPVIPMEAPMLP